MGYRYLLLCVAVIISGCDAATTSASASQDNPRPSNTNTLAFAPSQPALLPPTAYASTSQPPSAPAATTIPPPFVLAEQTAALLPDFAADITTTDRWDRYSINLDLNPDGPTYSGSMRLELTNRSDTPWNELYLHLYPNHPDVAGLLRVDDVRVNGAAVATTGEQGNVLLRVPLPRPLMTGAQTTVTMHFSGRTPRNKSRQAYGAFNQEAGVWSLATFYPVLARYHADGWDRRTVSSKGDFSVTDTALYDVRVAVPTGWVLATTGARVGPQTEAAGTRQERFVSGPQREFLVTALRGLAQASGVVNGTRVTSYYQPTNAAAGQQALQAAVQAVRVYNERFGRYPFAELDVVQAALTTFFGVEYPGIVLIEQSLYKRGTSLETTVAHEVGHQWWYSQVGNDAQGDPWLDEGLTSFTQIVYREGIGDSAGAAAELNGFRQSLRQARQAGRDGVSDRPVTAFGGNYVVLVYAKPALFFQALRVKLGDQTFYSFLQRYYSTYRYGVANGAGMIDAAQQTCACDLQRFYDDWIETSKVVPLP